MPTTPMMRALAAAIKANVPTLIWGSPGTGKTAKISASAERSGYHVSCVIGSIREPSDYLGLPIEVDGRVVYSPPAWAVELNDAKKGLLLLDELSTASPSVQKANLRLLQERYAGDLKLGDHIAIVGLANPPEEAADGWELPAPVANRLLHLDWHFDRDEWLANVATNFAQVEATPLDRMVNGGTDADKARAAGWVIAFLHHRPDLHNPPVPEDPYLAGKAWPSPRTWTNAISVLGELKAHDEEAQALVVTGCVGEAAAKEFFAWLATSDLYDPLAVLEDPAIVDWTSRPDRLFALLLSVEAYANASGEPRVWEKAMKVMVAAAENERPDIALPSVRNLLNHRPKGSKMPPRTREAFSDLMERVTDGFAAA